jgi:MFS family permease
MSIGMLGTIIGAVISVVLTQVFIDGVGWRATWLILAVVGAAVTIPPALIFMRRQPEDMGLRPDGATSPPSSATDESREALSGSRGDNVSSTLDEALHTATFWRLTFVFSIVTLGQSTIAIRRIPSFMDRGIDPRLVAYATALDAAAARR